MQFADTLLTWYADNKRALPWRGEHDPYKIWVSEIILQQTRVQQGWDYYLRFVDAFPTVTALVAASEEDVLRLWQGLGYYTRARNLHAAARQIVISHKGVFPDNYEEIRALKGVGDYTAAAIASIAFGLPYPAVDGNVLRVIARIFGIADDIAAPKTRTAITQRCAQLIDTRHPGHFNQAMMELGAITCLPKKPKCNECPFRHECHAALHNMTDTLPVKNNRIAKRDRFFHFMLYIYNNSIVLEKRTGRDIWRNLYQFPLQETPSDTILADGTCIAKMREVLTHQNIHALFYVVQEKTTPALHENQVLVPMEQIGDYPMPKIMVQFLKQQHFLTT
ncbi:MAG: A/G-specific adenine glycosylase [Bacteroidales bacterium]|nr:A/G-specific adenine glycosylase [Bacteroidales bacterium]